MGQHEQVLRDSGLQVFSTHAVLQVGFRFESKFYGQDGARFVKLKVLSALQYLALKVASVLVAQLLATGGQQSQKVLFSVSGAVVQVLVQV